MNLELYQNLLIRYSNQIYLIDDYGTKGVILCNESKQEIMRMYYKYKYHKFSLVEEKEDEIVETQIIEYPKGKPFSNIDALPKIVGYRKLIVNRSVYKIDIIEFAKFALNKGYDWQVYGEPEWNAIRPKKKKKLIKPRKR